MRLDDLTGRNRTRTTATMKYAGPPALRAPFVRLYRTYFGEGIPTDLQVPNHHPILLRPHATN